MAITHDKLEKLLKDFFTDGEVVVNDLAGDGEHYEVIVKSAKFNGLTLINQHKMVYDALGGRMGDGIHALKIKTIKI